MTVRRTAGGTGLALASLLASLLALAAGCAGDERVSCCWSDVSLGRDVACGIVADTQRAECWGGLFYDSPTGVWEEIPSLLGAPQGAMASLSPAASGPNCGLSVDGALRCSEWGQVAGCLDGRYAAEDDGVRPPPTEPLQQLFALWPDYHHMCALTVAGEARCWGAKPPDADVSDCSSSMCEVFSPPPGAFEDLTEYWWSACGRRPGTTTWECWGGNKATGDSQLSVGVFVDFALPDLEPQPFLDLVLGPLACGIGLDGRPRCSPYMRAPGYAPVVDAYWADQLEPSDWLHDGGYTELSIAETHVCALHESGVVDCMPREGPMGRSTSALYPDERFVALRTANDLTCVIRDDGALRCWGETEHGQLPPPDPGSPYLPVER